MDLLTFSALILACLPLVVSIYLKSKQWSEFDLPEKGKRIRDKEGNTFVVVEQWAIVPHLRIGRNIAGVYAVPEGGKSWIKFDLFDFEKGKVKVLPD